MPVKGLKVCTPTSIAYSGTSASINADGSVTFSACSSLSLNGVFTGDYDNYMVTIRATLSGGSDGFDLRLRASGSDNSTASSYVNQSLTASATSVSGGRNTLNYGRFSAVDSGRNGYTIYFFGPYLAQPTAIRSTNAYALSGASIDDRALTHNQSVAYDGVTFDPNITSTSTTFSGLVTVFGFNQ